MKRYVLKCEECGKIVFLNEIENILLHYRYTKHRKWILTVIEG